jgi:hypothetical protein
MLLQVVSGIAGDFIGRQPVTTSTEPQHLRFIRDYPDLNDVYFRFQTEGALGEINLGASDKMKEIERLSKEYLNTEASRQKIANCTVKFVQSLYDRIQ